MDMSFAVQALTAEWLTKQKNLEKRLYKVPDSIDDEIGRVKLKSMGITIDKLSPQQRNT
jgi:adenosylhomocysteinase